MSINLASLIAAIGAGSSGYMKGTMMREDRDRQKALDARSDEEYSFNKSQRDKQTSLDRDLADSQKDQQIEPAPVTNTGATYQSEDLLAADNRENRRNFEQTGQPTPAPMAPASFNANGQNYAERGGAQQAMLGVNSQASRDTRAAQVMRQHGQIEKARQYEDFAKKALDEGTDKILGAISATAPSVDAVKKAGGMVAGAVGADAADIFNKTGSHWKVSPDTVVQHFLDKDPAGREFVNSRVLGKDGKPVVDDVRGATMMLTDVKTRLDQQNKDSVAYQTGLRILEDARHNKSVEVQNASHDRAMERAAAGTLALAHGKDKREAALFKQQTIAGQLEQIESVVGPLSPTDRTAYGKKLLGLTAKDSKGVDDDLVKDLTKKWSENNPTSTPNDVAKFRDGLNKAFGAVHSNAQVENALRDEFGKNPPGTAGYTKTYNDAKTQLRMTDAQLAAMGYAAPKADKVPVAANGTMVPNPMAPSSVATTWQSPTESVQAQAAAGFDAALAQTARALAAANQAGNKPEVQRLNALFAEQSAAKQASLGGAQ